MRDQIVNWVNPTAETRLPRVEWAEGDYRLNPAAREPQSYIPAAVLVPLVAHESGMTVLLTLRTDHLNDHAGQVSFPGGRVEPGDADSVATALRESEEEIGLPPAHVEVVGYLDRYRTITGFDIEPVVGIVQPGFELAPDPFEVAEVFEIPLALILEKSNFVRRSRIHRGERRHFYEIPHHRFHIWGATAGILHNLCLRANRAAPID
ncbi:MAG: hypothetical protein Kow006_16480 [Gammaproteobacteria bacterium]